MKLIFLVKFYITYVKFFKITHKYYKIHVNLLVIKQHFNSFDIDKRTCTDIRLVFKKIWNYFNH